MPPADLHKQADLSPVAAEFALHVARLVEALGKPSLAGAVLEVLREQAVFDSALIVLYPSNRRPSVLIEALAHPMRSNGVEAYLAGAYLLDPFRMYAQTLCEPALVRLQEVVEEDFHSSDYFLTYYVASRLIDEINFLIPAARDQVIAVCLGRSQALTPFEACELARFRSWLPILSAVLRRHVAMPNAIKNVRSAEFEDREHDRLEARLATFGASLLTPREREVVQHLLRGSSAPDIAGRLSVSLQTVRVHRRNIYGKLEVSSLGQLFSLAMHTLLTGDA